MSSNMTQDDKDALIAELQQRVAELEAKIASKDREIEESNDWWLKKYDLINLIAREWKEKAERPEQAARVAGGYSAATKWVKWVKANYPAVFERVLAELLNSEELMLRLIGQDVQGGQRLWVMHDMLWADSELKALRKDRKRRNGAERAKRHRVSRSSTQSVMEPVSAQSDATH